MSLPSFLRDTARGLRRSQTDAERKLWDHLRNRQLGGVKFRRQYFIAPFIADFCCPEKWLIIELDGGQHAERVEADQRRTVRLESQGYRVMRFWNHEVLENIEGVLERIGTILSDPHPCPLPRREREGESADHGEEHQ
jgi:very-short-patch-repair endonuclease